MAKFVHYDLRLINPPFESPLTKAVMDLDHLRRLTFTGDTPAPLFYQLKRIFHFLESLGSARIEGNRTTLETYVETKIEGRVSKDEQIKEIENIEEAMEHIEQTIASGGAVTQKLIREIHQIVVKELSVEGDKTPGVFREKPVVIEQSDHKPPDYAQVQSYMDELEKFISKSDATQYDLLKIALTHHRFAWVHPFGNGNGRVVRLLTCAMLMNYGFSVHKHGRILNPTAIFCNDRDVYFSKLSKADTGSEEGLHDWCLYVLEGMRDELEKVDKLTSFDYLKTKILLPAINDALSRKLVTDLEAKILIKAVERPIKAGDLTPIDTTLKSHQRNYLIKRLIEKQMLQPIKEGGRFYAIHFVNNYLMRGIISALTVEGFIPSKLAESL